MSFSLPPATAEALEQRVMELGLSKSALATRLLNAGLGLPEPKQRGGDRATVQQRGLTRWVKVADDLRPQDDYLEAEWDGKRHAFCMDLLDVGEQMRAYYPPGQDPKQCCDRAKRYWHSYVHGTPELKGRQMRYQMRGKYLLVERVR